MAAKRLIEIGSLLSRSPGHVGVEAPVFKYAAVLLLLSWPADYPRTGTGFGGMVMRRRPAMWRNTCCAVQ